MMPSDSRPHPEVLREAEPRRTQGADATSKADLYHDLGRQLRSLIDDEPDRIANAANMAALIYHGLPDLNWVGFYFTQGGELVLGPFQGRPACVRIAWGNPSWWCH
jgi:putative methionine-R-sulfoxide reductase with GAF domain